MVGFTRHSFMVPIPNARDSDELNAMLRERCEARQQAVLRGENSTIAERLGKDRSAFMDLPPVSFEACDKRPGRVPSQALVRDRNNAYSVPVACAHREIIVKGRVDEGVIVSGGDEIARHRRSYETADFVFDPLHYLPLLEQNNDEADAASSSAAARSNASAAPASSSGVATFSSAVIVGIRWKDWNTTPI